MANTLIIGLGGTGIKTLIHVKKQLQDMSPNGKLPDNVQILGLDTNIEPEQIEGLGAWESAYARRTANDYKGTATINPSTEYNFVGGGAHGWVCGDSSSNEPGWQREHYGLDWFQKNYFCNHPNSEALLNIKVGAGMYRQIGRLATLFALRQGVNSVLFSQIKNKITLLKEDTIHVVIVGSFAGGTGAAMFIDIAHLVKKIAKQENKDTIIYGMFALPKAFNKTPPVVVDDSMKARGMVALREMVRFLSVHEKDLGFKIQFVDDSTHPILAARTEGALFRTLYLFDERFHPERLPEVPNPLNVRLEHGVCPTIATWIIALADTKSQLPFVQHFANRDMSLGGEKTEGLVPAVTGSVGTISYVLPIAAIVEDWTMRLASEAIDLLVPRYEDNLNPAMYGGKEGVDATGTAEHDWSNNPSSLAKDAGKIGISYDEGGSNSNQLESIISRSVQDWRELLFFNTDEDDMHVFTDAFREMEEESSYFYQERGFLQDPLKGAMVKTVSPRAHNNDERKAADALVRACNLEEQRKFTKWKPVIATGVVNHVSLYRETLRDFIEVTLNGELENSAENAKSNKSGKLGWLLQYINLQTKHLEYASLLLKGALKSQESQLQIAQDNIDPQKGGGVLAEMQSSASKQKDYLEVRQQVFFWRRWTMLCEAELLAIDQMHKITMKLRDKLQEHARMLVTGRENLTAHFTQRREEIAALRRTDELELVRKVIRDQAWEDGKYAQFTAGTNDIAPGIQRVMKDFLWEVNLTTEKPGTDEAFTYVNVNFKIEGWELDEIGELSSNKMDTYEDPKADEVRTNSQRFAARTRNEFEEVWDKLTVVDYLSETYNTQAKSPQSFARELVQETDVLLRLPDDPPLRMAFLMAPEGTNVHEIWLNQALEMLKQETNANENYSGVLSHTDRTTLTYLTVGDMVKIRELPAYTEGLGPYLRLPMETVGTGLSRQLHHIYPAEQTAVLFDQRREDGTYDLVRTRVVSVLEERGLLERFAQALAIGVIEDHLVTEDNKNVGNVKRVIIPPREGERDDAGRIRTAPHIWWLNEPEAYGDQKPSFIYAAETFCLRALDKSRTEKSMKKMHARLNEHLNNYLAEQLEQVYLPKWAAGEDDETGGVAAVQMPPGELRDTALWNAMRVSLYRKVLDDIAVDLKSNRLETLRPQVKPDEENFLDVLSRALSLWIRQLQS